MGTDFIDAEPGQGGKRGKRVEIGITKLDELVLEAIAPSDNKEKGAGIEGDRRSARKRSERWRTRPPRRVGGETTPEPRDGQGGGRRGVSGGGGTLTEKDGGSRGSVRKSSN